MKYILFIYVLFLFSKLTTQAILCSTTPPIKINSITIRASLLNKEAPPIEFKDANENTISLKEYKGKNIFLIFLPISTPTSFTSENTSFLLYLQKLYPWLQNQNTELLVLTPFTPKQIKTLKEKWKLDFPILTATDKEYFMYGAVDEYQIKRRTSFYIDEKQTICASIQRFDSEYHLAQLLLMLLTKMNIILKSVTDSKQTKIFEMACIDEKAPNIILQDINDTQSSLTDHFGKIILLYFLPNRTMFDPELPARYDDETIEHLTLVDSLQPWFEKNNGVIIGLTKLSTETIIFLKKKYQLKIDLYHENGPYNMFGLYGVHGDFTDLYRTSYLIDQQGLIRHFVQQDDPYHHIFHILLYLLTEKTI